MTVTHLGLGDLFTSHTVLHRFNLLIDLVETEGNELVRRRFNS